MSNFIGQSLKDMLSSRKELTLIIIMTISAGATEFTSNASISSIFLPIVDSIVTNTHLFIPKKCFFFFKLNSKRQKRWI